MFELSASILERTWTLQLVWCTPTNVHFLSEDLDFKPRYGECRFLLHGRGSCVEMFPLQINRHMLPRRKRSICHWPSLWLSICMRDEENGKPSCSSSSS